MYSPCFLLQSCHSNIPSTDTRRVSSSGMRGSSTTPTSINRLMRNVEGEAAALHLSISPLLLRRENPIKQAGHSGAASRGRLSDREGSQWALSRPSSPSLSCYREGNSLAMSSSSSPYWRDEDTFHVSTTATHEQPGTGRSGMASADAPYIPPRHGQVILMFTSALQSALLSSVPDPAVKEE